MEEKPTKGGVRAYARHRGCADNAVRKALTRGRIRYEPDGKTIDFAQADIDWAKNTDPSQQRPQKKQDRPAGVSAPAAGPRAPVRADEPRAASPSAKAGTKPTAGVAAEPSRPSGAKRKQPPADADMRATDEAVGLAEAILRRHGKAPSEDGFTMVDASTAEKLQKMEQRQIEIDRERGTLVSRRVLNRVFAAARLERDSWLQWIVRNVAEMAVELGVSPHTLEVTLNKHARNHLASLADIDIGI